MNYIATADWHIRPDRPRCRTDEDWLGFQRACIREVVEIANRLDARLLIAGDVFDTPTVPPYLVTMVIEELTRLDNPCFLIAGNHDLAYHSAANLGRSSLGTLLAAGSAGADIIHATDHMTAADFGEKPSEDVLGAEGWPVMLHRFVVKKPAEIPPGMTGAYLVDDLAAEFPDRLVVCGDRHDGFQRGRIVVPGSLNRQTADQKQYAPRVYLLTVIPFAAGATIIKEIVLETDAGDDLVDDAYLRTAEEREDRISAFVEVVRSSGTVSLSFVDNLRAAAAEHREALGPAAYNIVEAWTGEETT